MSILVSIPVFWCHCCCSATKSCLTLCHPIDCSMPGSPSLHYLSEFAQTHVHWIGDAIQPSQRLSSPLLLPSILSRLQGFFLVSQLFTSGGPSIGTSASASVLWMNIQGWFFRIDLLSKRWSRVFSSTTIWKHQFFCI